MTRKTLLTSTDLPFDGKKVFFLAVGSRLISEPVTAVPDKKDCQAGEEQGGFCVLRPFEKIGTRLVVGCHRKNQQDEGSQRGGGAREKAYDEQCATERLCQRNKKSPSQREELESHYSRESRAGFIPAARARNQHRPPVKNQQNARPETQQQTARIGRHRKNAHNEGHFTRLQWELQPPNSRKTQDCAKWFGGKKPTFRATKMDYHRYKKQLWTLDFAKGLRWTEILAWS